MHRVIGVVVVAGAVLALVPTSASADPLPLPSITLPLLGPPSSPSASPSSPSASPSSPSASPSSPSASPARTVATARTRPAPSPAPSPATSATPAAVDVPSLAAMVESAPQTHPSAPPGTRSAAASAQGQQADAAPSDSGHWVRWGIVMAALLGIALMILFGWSPRRYVPPAEAETDDGYARGFLAGRERLRDELGEGGDPPLSGPIGIVR